MSGLNGNTRGRVLMAGKIIFNFGQSTINCLVRRITEDGATIELESGVAREVGLTFLIDDTVSMFGPKKKASFADAGKYRESCRAAEVVGQPRISALESFDCLVGLCFKLIATSQYWTARG